MRLPREFIFKPVNGKLPQNVQDALNSFLMRAKDQTVIISARMMTKIRSGQQNRFYWGVVIPMVKQMFEEQGNSVDSEEVHCYLRAHIGKLTQQIKDPNGKMRNILKSSTQLTTMEWEEYTEKIRAWAAEFELEIPLPNEQKHQGNTYDTREPSQRLDA